MVDESGVPSSFNDLLVFGYSCKLFRDDEKALFIENGGHLIPWMGDAKHMIDHYDGRATIPNLSLFEAPEEEGGGGGFEQLDSEERRIEELCDEERYLSIGEDDFDSACRQEEAERRGVGGEIGFDYSNPPQQQQQQQPAEAVQQQEDQQQQQPPSLRTLANCIEKTAEFIVTHGAQMEILMRAKEANNPKFQFLNPDNPYNPIYKQVLETKRKRPKNYIASLALMRQASLEVEKSLQILTSALPNAAPNLSGNKPDLSSSSASSGGSSYSRLVERIRESQPQPPAPPPQPVAPAETPPPAAAAASPPPPAHIVEVVPPPITLQPLIDKTASYVAKNGADVMSVVRKHEPEKFAFLREGHVYNMFFQYKLALYREMLAEKREGEKRSSLSLSDVRNGVQQQLSQEEQMLQVTTKFPTLKGFFR